VKLLAAITAAMSFTKCLIMISSNAG